MFEQSVTRRAGAGFPRRLLGASGTALTFLIVGIAAFLLWPTSLGGCTTLTIVSGHSMEPTYYTGDLVVARCGKPSVGDVIVYQPKDLGGPRIIHRVRGGDASTGWTMKGDNNTWIDPFHPRSSEVLGVARLHVPKVGLVLRALTSPFIWGSLILIALGLFMWPRAEDVVPVSTGDDGSEAEGAAGHSRATGDEILTSVSEPVLPETAATESPSDLSSALDLR
jgi:signal peptidase